MVKFKTKKSEDNRSAIGSAIKAIDKNINIDAVVIMTESGSTSIVVSQFRLNADLYALTPNQDVCKRLTLIWGIVPILTSKFLFTHSSKFNVDKIFTKSKPRLLILAKTPNLDIHIIKC